MSYALFILRRARKELSQITEPERREVIDSIRMLIANPRPTGCVKLTGREAWRIRVGNYRVIYEINDKNTEILVMHAGHGRDVYR